MENQEAQRIFVLFNQMRKEMIKSPARPPRLAQLEAFTRLVSEETDIPETVLLDGKGRPSEAALHAWYFTQDHLHMDVSNMDEGGTETWTDAHWIGWHAAVKLDSASRTSTIELEL